MWGLFGLYRSFGELLFGAFRVGQLRIVPWWTHNKGPSETCSSDAADRVPGISWGVKGPSTFSKPLPLPEGPRRKQELAAVCAALVLRSSKYFASRLGCLWRPHSFFFLAAPLLYMLFVFDVRFWVWCIDVCCGAVLAVMSSVAPRVIIELVGTRPAERKVRY